jgi:hypothetical protein
MMMMIDRMARLTGMNALAKLLPVVPSKDRIIVTHTIEDRWDDKYGWHKVVINKIKGLEWNIGKEYDHDGFVNRINTEILQGKYA